MDYYKKYLKYKTKYIQLKKNQNASGHGHCKQCDCDRFDAENFNQSCKKCNHTYKNHKLTKSDWMIQIYNITKLTNLTNFKGDFCNLNSCKYCDCNKFIDNLIDDKCEKCGHNVLNHCKTYPLSDG